ncbi:glycosyltransferase [Pontibacter ruber]|uniref:Glycosyltransferase n=1 Tax=Pontibacter ruber TaxID=1343895 RepID=A0ABW5D0Z2_9BACT|nr:glycosyltransferase [Pontibacter ruber]
MRVVHVVECFAAGTAHFVNLLTRYTIGCEHVVIHGERLDEIKAELVKAKFPNDVTFIKWEGAQREIRPGHDLKALTTLLKILKGLEFDVVHLHSSKAGFLGRVACFMLGIKNVVYTPNGAAFSREDVSERKKKMYITLEKIAYKLSGQVVCCSLSEAQNYHKIGIDATYINNGTTLPQLSGVAGMDANEVKVEDVFTIVTCGRVTEQKNPVLFNQIAASFAHRSDVRFVWIGSGDEDQTCLLSSPNINITGWLPKEEVLATIQKADLYLSSALWEGLPFSVLEALSLGKCLLLSKCVGNVDLVRDGYNGFSYRTAAEAVEKIEWLLGNREILKEMAAHSRAWCEKDFDVEVVFKKYEELYQSLVLGE